MKVVAEIGINANGDVNIAKKLIDISKDSGCEYVKFQKRNIDIVYTKEELDKPCISPWGNTVRDKKKALEFTYDDYLEIDKFCSMKGIRWFASPWDITSLYFIMQFNIPYIKIASAMVTNIPLIEEISKTDIPVILSTGMSTYEEINKCIDILQSQIEYILVCCSAYPCPDGKNKIYLIPHFKELYGNKYKIGFSSHSPDIIVPCLAASLGAEMIEVHVTLSHNMYGSDQGSSIEACKLIEMNNYIRMIENEMCVKDWVIYPEEEVCKRKLRGKYDQV